MKKSPSITSKLPAAGALTALVLLWLAVSEGGIVPAFLLPSPVEVVQALVSDAPILWENALVTLAEAAWGLGIGILAALVIFLLIFMMPSCSNNEPNRNDYNVTVPESTYNRTKLDSGLPYDSNCIDDQLGWFENRTSAAKRLKVFYDKTGIQPYILFAKYNPKLTTDDEKQAWAREWYDDHIDNEDTLLFVYFAEQDVDNDVGYMTLVNGKHVSSIMDAQATEIFWTYLDEYWFSDRSTDDAIVATFDSTADRIMTKTTTRNDVHKWVIIAVIVIGVLAIGAVVAWMLIKRKREHEQYVERMVTTPLDEARDPILEKYDQADHNDQVGQEQKGQ